MEKELSIRLAVPDDAPSLLAIYAPYVTGTAISFETKVPDISEFEQRIASTLTRYPYLVAEENDQIIGYAYASALSPRQAYDWSVETTVYLKQDVTGRGIGTALYHELFSLLGFQHFSRAFACIADTNTASVHFHESLGFSKVGCFSKCGYKNGTWLDVVWLEKDLCPSRKLPEPLLPLDSTQGGL